MKIPKYSFSFHIIWHDVKLAYVLTKKTLRYNMI